jgi:hypothetical protein
MTGRTRLPAGEQRKASQKRARKAVAMPIRVEIPWATGDRVKWRDREGVFRRHVDDEYAEVDIGGRVYRVRRAELRAG